MNFPIKKESILNRSLIGNRGFIYKSVSRKLSGLSFEKVENVVVEKIGKKY